MACRFLSLFPLGLPATELRGFSGRAEFNSNVVLTEIERVERCGRSAEAQSLGLRRRPLPLFGRWDCCSETGRAAIVLGART